MAPAKRPGLRMGFPLSLPLNRVPFTFSDSLIVRAPYLCKEHKSLLGHQALPRIMLLIRGSTFITLRIRSHAHTRTNITPSISLWVPLQSLQSFSPLFAIPSLLPLLRYPARSFPLANTFRLSSFFRIPSLAPSHATLYDNDQILPADHPKTR